MTEYLNKLLRLNPGVRFLLLLAIGVALTWDLLQLENGRLSFDKPKFFLSQNILGILLLLWAFLTPVVAAVRALRADFSNVLSGRLVLTFGYDQKTLLTLADELSIEDGLDGLPVVLPQNAQFDRWQTAKSRFLESLDKQFASYYENEFYGRLDEMQSEATLYLDAEKLPARGHTYRLVGIGEIIDEVGDVRIGSRITVDRHDPTNTFTVQPLRALVRIFRRGIPIVFSFDQYLKPIGDDKKLRAYLYFRLRFSLIEWDWKVSPALGFIRENGGACVVLGYAKDFAFY